MFNGFKILWGFLFSSKRHIRKWVCHGQWILLRFFSDMEVIGPRWRMETGVFVQGWFAVGRCWTHLTPTWHVFKKIKTIFFKTVLCVQREITFRNHVAFLGCVVFGRPLQAASVPCIIPPHLHPLLLVRTTFHKVFQILQPKISQKGRDILSAFSS